MRDGRSRWIRAGSLTCVGVLALALLGGGLVTGADGGKAKVRWFVGLGAPESQSKERKKAIKAVVKEFNRQNKDIKLVVDIEADDVHDALGERLLGGKAPDLIGPATPRVLGYADAFADLGPLADAAGFDLGAFDPALIEAYRADDGRLIGLPFGAFPSVLYYNRDLFDAAGLAYPPSTVGEPYVLPDGAAAEWDLETVARVAQLLTVDASGNDATSPDFDPSAIVQFGLHFQFADLRRTGTSLGGAGSLASLDATGGVSVDIPDGWRDAWQWSYDATWLDHSMPNGEEVAGPLLGNNPFGSGHVAMAVAPLWYTCCIADANGERLDGWDLAVMPTGLTGVTTSPLDSDVLAVAARSKDPEAAFQVLRYLLDDPRAGALWAVAPAISAERPAWYAGMSDLYPGVTDWAAADAMLGFADVSHQSDLPNHAAALERLAAFQQLMLSDGSLDLQVALDTLEADLQAIADDL